VADPNTWTGLTTLIITGLPRGKPGFIQSIMGNGSLIRWRYR